MTPAQKDPFFAPLWRRVATLVISVAWFGLELWGGNPTWMVISGFAAAYTIWALFIAFEQPDKAKEE